MKDAIQGYAGLAILGIGLAFYDWRVALVVVGGALFLLGALGLVLGAIWARPDRAKEGAR